MSMCKNKFVTEKERKKRDQIVKTIVPTCLYLKYIVHSEFSNLTFKELIIH